MPGRENTEIYNIVGLAIILPYVALYFLYRTDPRYLIAVALVLLVSAAVEDSAGNAAAANDIAIVSYYCLVAGVVMMIVDGYIETHRNGRLSRKLHAIIAALRDRFLDSERVRLFASWILPVAVFTLLSLLIMQDFLSPGYVLVTDMVFGPIVPTSGLYGLYPYIGGGNALIAFEALLSGPVPGWAIEKMFIFLIFFLSGFSMYLFAGSRLGPSRYFASFLYMVNPFIYARMLAGAWALSLAYALVPLALLSFINMLETGKGKCLSYRSTFLAASMFSLVAVFDSHTFAIIAFLAVLYFAVSAIYRWQGIRKYLERTAFPLAIFLSLLLLFNAYWLVAAPAGSSGILGGFTFLDAIAFASQPTVFHNTMLSIAAMYGFFRTGYIYPVTFYPSLALLFLFFLFLALFGALSNWRDRKTGPLTVTLAIGLVLSVILATGISSPLTSGIYTYLYNNLPFFNGFREPQKLVAIVVLGYSYLGALGLHEFEGYLRTDSRSARKVLGRASQVAIVLLIIFSLLLPFAYSYMELNGFNGQLTNVQYPSSWYRAENIMAQNSTDYSVLVFPWHTYMYYNWSHTKFASPFNLFFRQNLIFGGTNSYVGGEGTLQTGPQMVMAQVLSERNSVSHLGNIMSLFDAKYVFLSKSADYQNYSFLYTQKDLTLVLNSSQCALFVNDHAVSRAYIVQRVMHVASYSELVNLSSTVNMMDYAWVVGNYTGPVANSSSIHVQSREINDASFSVALPGLIGLNTTNYLIFIPPAGSVSSWRTNSNLLSYYAVQSAISNSSIGPELYSIYRINGGPADITLSYAPFRQLESAYAVSGVVFAAASFFLLLTYYPQQAERLKRVILPIRGKQK